MLIVAQEKAGRYGLSTEEPQSKKVRKSRLTSRGPWLAMISMVFILFLVGVLITCYYSSVFALGYKIHKLQQELSVLRVEKHDLEAEIKRLSSLERVEAIAVKRLGMVKPDSSNIMLLTVAGQGSQDGERAASEGESAASSTGKDEGSVLIRTFADLVNRLGSKIMLGPNREDGSEEGRYAVYQYRQPEADCKNPIRCIAFTPWVDFSPGLDTAC